MVKIIEYGNTHRTGRCPICWCRLEFSDVDINRGGEHLTLTCPDCGLSSPLHEFREE